MEVNAKSFAEQKGKAENTYSRQNQIFCPYFNTNIILNSDGFHHLQFSARRERNKREQLLKFRLLPLALQVLRKSGTVQEYRSGMIAAGGTGKRDGLTSMKTVQYWAFVAIVGDQNPIRIRVITRKVGNGNVTFWSVMLHSKIKNGRQRLYSEDIEDEEHEKAAS